MPRKPRKKVEDHAFKRFKLPKITWDKEYDLSSIDFYEPAARKLMYVGSMEVHIEGIGNLIIDLGSNDEILGIESLSASSQFPEWALEQAEILSGR